LIQSEHSDKGWEQATRLYFSDVGLEDVETDLVPVLLRDSKPSIGSVSQYETLLDLLNRMLGFPDQVTDDARTEAAMRDFVKKFVTKIKIPRH
jgi:hypothetical protein